MLGALTVAAWAGLLLPIIFEYQADRDISRLTSQALLIWGLMLVFAVADRASRWRPQVRLMGIAALVLACLGGLFVAGIQMTAASSTQLGAGFDKLDAELSAQVWGTLPAEARVFGSLGSTTILTGHLAGQLMDMAPEGSTWYILERRPDLDTFRLHGFDYVHIDSRWWNSLPADVRASANLDDECVEYIAEVWDNARVNYRHLLDLSNCN